jgi:hypothetical protein
MRDLKADLELCNKATPGPWKNFSDTFEPTVYTKELDGCRGSCIARMFGLYTEHTKANAEFVAQAREGWPHAIERAIKAETLARELARELEEIKKRGDWLKRDCTEPDKVMIYAIDISIIGNGTLAKAKEVLGDGNNQRQGG